MLSNIVEKTQNVASSAIVNAATRHAATAPKPERIVTIDGNHAAAHVAYHMSEMAILFPITPATPMGELSDAWSVAGEKNIFGNTTKIHQMQSEGGVAGALHGALLGGSLTCTFTSSQGLLLMIPNMYKIAGELLPGVLHLATRNLGTHAQCIYQEHSDLMAIRSTGWPVVYSSNVQECQDLALVSHLAAVEASLPFVHAFDGFRTSHEISKISEIAPETMRGLINEEAIEKFRARALNPNNPSTIGCITGETTSFQSTEALAPYHARVPEIVQAMMDKVASVTGRPHKLFEYGGAEDAEHVIVVMGSGAGPVKEAVEYLSARGEKVGYINVHLFRPFSAEHLLKAIPKTTKTLTVLERYREQTAREPMYLDIVDAVHNSEEILGYRLDPKILNGVYGLAGFPFTPSHAVTVFDNAKAAKPRRHFSVGIVDDLMHNSLPLPTEAVDSVAKGTVQCMFYGLGSDGTVGANKEAISLIADFQPLWEHYLQEHPEEKTIKDKVANFVPGDTYGDFERSLYCQGYFAYDAKKSGGLTISHLRFGQQPIESQYAIDNADYIACHVPIYVHKYDMVSALKPKGTFVLNAPWTTVEQLNEHLPANMRRQLAEKHARLYVVDAFKIAKDIGLGQRINMIMQTVFYGLTNVLPLDSVLKLLRQSIAKTYGKKGKKVVDQNCAAVDQALSSIHEIQIPAEWSTLPLEKANEDLSKPEFVRNWMEVVDRQQGTTLKTSDMIVGRGMPNQTTVYEKRGIAVSVPQWNKEKCIQCGLCSIACPHTALRAYLLDGADMKAAPKGYEAIKARGKGLKDMHWSIQISPLDCMGCGVCANVCPVGALSMVPQEQQLPVQSHFDWSYHLPNHGDKVNKFSVKGAAVQKPYLEFHGACPGCGEAPYVEMLSRLYGDRLSFADASGCSVVWMGTQGWNPWALDKKGRGAAFANSLFEDNAEFGFGMTVAHNTRRDRLRGHVEKVIEKAKAGQLKHVKPELVAALEKWVETFADGEPNRIATNEVEKLLTPEIIADRSDADLVAVVKDKDMLVKQAIWIIGGDGWAYDIGFGGLDHVMASGKDVNVLVLDTNVYSNTGGQKSKATPISAVAKFAAGGNTNPPKDLGRIFMTYGNAYVASVSMGYDPAHTIKVLKEAESYHGPSIVIAYCPCINQGLKSGMGTTMEEEKIAVETGMWPLYRFDPRRGDKPFQLDSPAPSRPISDLLDREVRFTSLGLIHKDASEEQRKLCDEFVQRRYKNYLDMERAQQSE